MRERDRETEREGERQRERERDRETETEGEGGREKERERERPRRGLGMRLTHSPHTLQTHTTASHRDTTSYWFTPYTAHGQQPAGSQGRPPAVCCDATILTLCHLQWSGEGATGFNT
jgi:hypothetical protein